MSRLLPIFSVTLATASFLLCASGSFAQTVYEPSLPSGSTAIAVNFFNKDSTFQLPHRFISSLSDSVVLDSSRILRRGADYVLDYTQGSMTLDSAFKATLFVSGAQQHTLDIFYRYFPFQFQESYFRRKLVVLRDSVGRDTLRVAKPRSSFGLDDIFGQNLQKSGSIVRGFTVGSNRDLSLNSGLRLQLSGKLTNDIDVVAALTDENTPIQPEGTTQTLQEFDKVFVELRSTAAAATLGDFTLDFTGTEFARLSRKLQGAKATADYSVGFSRGSATASAATTRGKFHTNQFQGLEGVQGPYRLTGRNNERQIIIIAGTERVYVNGELQTRGETNDYTIDYSNGELRFTTRRLITAASRITVDFEYTDRQFSRSLLAGQSASTFWDNRATFTFSFLREADDPDAPIDVSLTDSARAILQAAGDDRSKAVLSGVTPVDSNGFYVLDSTVIGTTTYRFYRYAPGPNARYVVTFSSVGFGQGDYVRTSVGVFEWKGPGLGDYLPIKFLPLPQLSQVMDLALDIKPVDELRVSGEYASSTFDGNRLSSLNDEDNRGQAVRFEAAYAPREITIGTTNIGSLDVRVKERFIDRRFVPVDRTNDIEFNRKWGIQSLTPADEEIQEASVRYSPFRSLSIGGGYGKITRGNDLRSVRNEASFAMKGDSLPTINYLLESVRSRETPSDNASSWLRQKGAAEYVAGIFVPSFYYESENRKLRFLTKDSLKAGSFKFNVFAPGLELRNLWTMSFAVQLEWRTDDQFLNGSVVRESKSTTQSFGWKLPEWNALSSSLDVKFRKKRFSPAFKALGNNDIQTVLVRNQTRYAPLNRGLETDLFYEVSTERASRLERVFVRVAVGSGNYKYLGDLNNNGVADENEFVPARFDGDYIATTLPSDALYPVIDLKTSARLRITPSRFLGPSTSSLDDILKALSTETYVRVEEKSSEPDLKAIYLLHFSRFQSDSTITGSTLFTQDINVLEGRPEFSARLRYSQRKGLNRFASSTSSGAQERGFARERSVRLRWQLVTELANQVDVVNRIDRVSSTERSLRLRNIESNLLALDFSYRPIQQIELGMKFEVGKATDRHPVPEVNADLNTQALRFVYAFEGAGQARAEFAREEIRLSRTLESFPFELTGGREQGRTFIWRAGFDYRVAQFIQANLSYDGRSEGGRAPVHTARAEVRAFF